MDGPLLSAARRAATYYAQKATSAAPATEPSESEAAGSENVLISALEAIDPSGQ